MKSLIIKDSIGSQQKVAKSGTLPLRSWGDCNTDGCIYIFMHYSKRDATVLLAKGYLKAIAFVAIIAVIIGIMCAIDFTWVFTEFHHIFFDNDLWILYPDKDNLINIMQEVVFFDAAKWIAGIWLAVCAVLAAISAYIINKSKQEG